MKFLIVFILLILSASVSLANASKIDSLKNIISPEYGIKARLAALELLIDEYKAYNLDSALIYCDQYASITQHMNDQELLAKSNYNYASVYSIAGNFELMSTYAYTALEQFKSIKNAKGQVDILLILARMFASKQEFDKAYEAYNEALEIAGKSKNVDAMIMINIGISNAYFLEQELEQSEDYLLKCIELVETHPLEDSAKYLAKIYTNLGNVNSAKTNDLDAIAYYKKSHNYYWKSNDKFGISLTAFNIGDVYNYNNMYDSALKYFKITEQMGNDLHNYEELFYANLGFTELYERKGEFDKAFQFQKSKHAYADSLKIQKYNKSVVELEKKYNAEKKASELIAKEKEIAISEREKQDKQNIIILLSIGGGVLFVLSIGLLVLYRRVSHASELIKKQSQSIDKTLKQKEILLQEVHHRVKNNLQLIASLLNLQLMSIENESARRAIEESKSRVQAIALMHKGLYQDDNYNSVHLKSYVNELIDNQKTLSNSSELKLDFKVKIDPIDLDIDKSVPVGLILSELISNSLKHAFKGLHQGIISISIIEQDGTIILDYSDNGIGLPEDFNIEHQESLGFTLISALTDQLNGTMTFESYTPFKWQLRF